MHSAASAALAAQAKDPDNGTDPDDDEVGQHLSTAMHAATAALHAQAEYAAPDLDDGTTPLPVAGLDDATGSRSAKLSLELEAELSRSRMTARRELSPSACSAPNPTRKHKTR